MSFTIYSIGDVNFLAEIINAVAMLTAVPDFTRLIQIGLVIGVIFVMFQSIFQGAKQINWHQVFLGWIMYMAFFVPTTTVTILDSYTATARVISNVPMVIGVAGGVISRIGYGVTRMFEQGYGNVDFSLTNRRFADSLQILNKIRRQGTDTRLFDSLNKGASQPGADFRQSWYNYMNECVMVKLALGDTTLEDMYSKNWQEAFKFQTAIFPTEINVNGTPQTMLCGQAFSELISKSQESMNQPAFQAALNRIIGDPPDGFNNPGIRVSNALQSMNAQQTAGLAMNQAHAYVLTSMLEPLYHEAAAGHYNDMQDFASAMMINQALMQRNTQWAAEQTMFMSVVRPMVTFFEGFIYAITPVMAFLLVLGAVGVSLAGKYFLVLFWIQLWMPVLSIVNLFINTVAASRIEQLNSDNFGMTSMYALSTGSDILQNWIATGGMLAAATPIIALFIVTGSSYAFTHLAGRINGADHINERMNAPDVAQPAPLIQQSAGYQIDPTMGFRTTGAENIVNTYSTGATAAANTRMFEGQAISAQKAVSQTMSGMLANSTSVDAAYSKINDITSRVGSMDTREANLINSKAMQVTQGSGLSHAGQQAVQSAMTSSIGFGLPFNTNFLSASLQKTDSNLDSEAINSIVQRAENASKDLRFSDGEKASLTNSLVANFTDKNSKNFSEAWSSEEREAFAKQATEMVNAQQGWEQAQSYQQSMGASHSYNDLHVGTGALENRHAQKTLHNWLRYNATQDQEDQINADALRFQGRGYNMNAESARLAAVHKTMYGAAQGGDANASSSLLDFQSRMYGIQNFAPKPFSKELVQQQAPNLPDSALSQKVDAHVPTEGSIWNRNDEARTRVAGGQAMSAGYENRVNQHHAAASERMGTEKENQMRAEQAVRHEKDRENMFYKAYGPEWKNQIGQEPKKSGEDSSARRKAILEAQMQGVSPSGMAWDLSTLIQKRKESLMQEARQFNLTDADREAYGYVLDNTNESYVKGYNHLAESEYSNVIERDKDGGFVKNENGEYAVNDKKSLYELRARMELIKSANTNAKSGLMSLAEIERFHSNRPGYSPI